MNAPPIPSAFIWRRLHSLAGLGLVIYLINHLLINSQAALFFGDDGRGFISSVNSIHELPYLSVIEILILGVPFFIHGVWGVQYLWTAKLNSYRTDGSQPSLPEYSRNRAFSWQRITSWILLLGIIAHVVHMRFLEYPTHAFRGTQNYFMVRLGSDEGLDTLSERLGVKLFSKSDIQNFKENLPQEESPALQAQWQKQTQSWLEALEARPLTGNERIAVAKDFGTAELLMVRETFKNPWMMAIYTLFVLAACYHAFNGLWTCLITWGIILTEASQRVMLKISQGLMVIVAFLGLAAIWATYWINLKS